MALSMVLKTRRLLHLGQWIGELARGKRTTAVETSHTDLKETHPDAIGAGDLRNITQDGREAGSSRNVKAIITLPQMTHDTCLRTLIPVISDLESRHPTTCVSNSLSAHEVRESEKQNRLNVEKRLCKKALLM